MAHNRLEEIRATARQTGHQAECVEIIVRLDALRDAVEQFKSKVDSGPRP